MNDYDEATGWPVVAILTDLSTPDEEVVEMVEMARPAELEEAHRQLAERAGTAVFKRAEVQRRLGALVHEHPALKSAPGRVCRVRWLSIGASLCRSGTRGRAHGCAEMHPVLHLLSALRGFRRALVAVWRDPETKALPFVVGILLVSGTVFYWSVEDWTVIQALYFSVVTLTTVGYGDLTPTSDFSRIFTIIYLFIGLGVLVAFLSSLAQHYIRLKVEDSARAREHLSALTHHDQPPE